MEKRQGRTLVQSFQFGERKGSNPGLEFGESNGPNLSLAGSELDEKTGSNPGSEFGFRERNGRNSGSTGSDFGEEPG